MPPEEGACPGPAPCVVGLQEKPMRPMPLAVLTALVLTLALGPAANAATIYTYTGNTYTSILDTGPPGVYTTSMSITGSFTTAAPLAANLSSANVTAQVTAWSFFDGRLSYTEAGPYHVPALLFQVSTDGGGLITGWRVQIQEQSCYPCHAIVMRSDIGDRASQWTTTWMTEDAGIVSAFGSWSGGGVPEPSAGVLLLAATGWVVHRKRARG
jgi:hypothetical protein